MDTHVHHYDEAKPSPPGTPPHPQAFCPCPACAGSEATLLGFIGTPWTLAAYAIEGKAEKDCRETKRMMMQNPEVLHALLDHLTEALVVYAGYQIESGAQIIQLFDSWAHHLTPSQFTEFSLPYADRITNKLKAMHPHVPVIFHANGGGSKG